ncbi:NAD(P)/FAD-dependent oxidoreductase [Candidatus Woesearchaeota archaeon]|nr:MAG: NAD(P)/FAD-dependent oxidoreductase [Candidatus Woesearchaeota archaeon]
MKDYDVIIIGAGPAGLSASIFCARSGLTTLLIGDPQKAPWYTAQVDNYPGINGATGKEIALAALEQAKQFGAEHLNEEATSAQQDNEQFIITTSRLKKFRTKALIITVGIGRKGFGIPGEKEFKGRGVHECVLCDGFFYKNKKVAVIGSNNHAAQEALLLKQFTQDITILSPREPQFTKELQEALKGIEVKRVKIKEFKGTNKLTTVVFEDGEEDFDAVFLALGGAKSFATQLGLELTKEGFIKVDDEGRTNIKGVFAAGACTGAAPQAAKSAGDASAAAIAAIKFVKGIERYVDY